MPHIRIIGGHPQICVKDRTLWWQHPVAGPLIEELNDAEISVDAIYEGVQEDFWRNIAPDVADEHGYGRELYSKGRSGGWLELASPPDLTACECRMQMSPSTSVDYVLHSLPSNVHICGDCLEGLPL